MNIQKPTKIYEEHPIITTGQTTTKRFVYEKPEGWDKKPKRFKGMSWFERVITGLRDEPMEPSDQKKYDTLAENARVFSITFASVFLLILIGVKTASMGEPYPEHIKSKDKYGAKLLDELVNLIKGEEKKYTTVSPDTIFVTKQDTTSTSPSPSTNIQEIMTMDYVDTTIYTTSDTFLLYN